MTPFEIARAETGAVILHTLTAIAFVWSVIIIIVCVRAHRRTMRVRQLGRRVHLRTPLFNEHHNPTLN